MKPLPGLYPRETPRDTGSNAELIVYKSLKTGLPGGWYAWLSLRIMEESGVLGEGDFVIVNPERGLLVLEVKGGNIEQKDGRRFQNSKPMPRDPRTQAYEFADPRQVLLTNCGGPQIVLVRWAIECKVRKTGRDSIGWRRAAVAVETTNEFVHAND